jgi:hypothetical protein
MSSLVISGDTSGSVTLQAPAVAGSTILTLPATSGTVLTTASGTAATATNLAGGSNGTIPYQSASGTTQMLAVGTAGQVLTSAGASAPTWASAASATVQTFTSSGTWTKPSGANFVMVEVLGAGGGGGSGRRGASASLRPGGAGGAGGAFMTKTFLASEIGSRVTVTVGAGGAGGAAVTVNTTSGVSGVTGGQSAFGNYLRVWGGTSGTGGTGSATTTGGAGGGTLDINAPLTAINGATGTTYIPGSFARSFKVTGSLGWPGAGFGGGSGGFYNSSISGGESSVYGGGGGGSGGFIDTSDNIQLCSKGGGNYANASVSGYQIGNYAKGANGLPKFGGAGGSAYNGVSTTPFNFDASAFGNSTFVVVNNANTDGYAIQASTDSGVTWTQYRIGMAISNLLWDGSKWVALSSDNTIHTTTDFINWTTAGVCGDVAGGEYMNCIAYYNGTYVVVGVFGAIQTSTDLAVWTSQASGIASISSNYIVKVTHDGTRWIAVGYFNATSTGIFLTSTDAVTWTNLSANLPATTLVYQIASSGSTYVIGVNDGNAKLLFSTNGGTSWTDTGSPTLDSIATGAVYAGGKFVFATTANIYYSTTGTSAFTGGYTIPADALGSNANQNCVASNGTTYIASINYSGVYAAVTTTDLISYTRRNAGTGLPAVPATGGNGGIGAGGGGGGASLNGFNSGAGGSGGNGLVRVYTW